MFKASKTRVSLNFRYVRAGPLTLTAEALHLLTADGRVNAGMIVCF